MTTTNWRDLPRKKKKKLYGKIGKRKHLALALVDDEKIMKEINKMFNLDYGPIKKMLDEGFEDFMIYGRSEYHWPINNK